MSAPGGPDPGPENRDGNGERDAKTGRFRPGNVANPKGRPKDIHGIAELARSYAPAAIERLVVLARGRGSAAVAACKELLDRGLGKAPQAIDATIRRGGPDALGGSPDAARARLEGMIEAAQAGAMAVLQQATNDAEPDHESGEKGQITEVSPALTADGSASCPTVAPDVPTEGTP